MWSTLLLFIKRMTAKSKLKKEQAKLNKNNTELTDNVDNKKTKKLKKEIKILNISITISITSIIAIVVAVVLLISYVMVMLGSLFGYNIWYWNKQEDAKAEEDVPGWEWDAPDNPGNIICPCGCFGGSSGSSGDGWGYSTGVMTNNGIQKEIVELSFKIYNESGKIGIPYMGFFIPYCEGGISFSTLSSKYLADLKKSGSIYTGHIYTSLGWHNKYGGDKLGEGGFGLDYPAGFLKVIPNNWITDLKITSYDSKITNGPFTDTDEIAYLPNWLYGTVGQVADASASNQASILKYIEDPNKFNSLSTEAKNHVYAMAFYANNYHKAGFFYGTQGVPPLVAMTQNGKSNVVLDWYCDLAKAIVEDGKRDEVFQVFKNYGFSNNKYEQIAKGIDGVLGTGTKYYDGIRVYMKNSKANTNVTGFPHLQTDWMVPFKGLYNGYAEFEKCVEIAGGKLVVDKNGGSSGDIVEGAPTCNCIPDSGCCNCHSGTVPLPPGGDITSKTGTPNGPWWQTPQEMSADIAKLPNGATKTAMERLAPDVGYVPSALYPAKIDKFKRSDGTGFILYVQSNNIDPWGPKKYGSSFDTFGYSGCMYYSAAMIASTMTHTYINPAEFVIATRTLGVRGYNGLLPLISSSYIENTKSVFMSLGLNVWPKLGGGYARDRNTFLANVDSCLAKGGLVYYSVGAGTFTTSTHFLVIREKVGNNYLVGNSSTSKIDKEYTPSQVLNGFKSYILVYPPGVTHS